MQVDIRPAVSMHSFAHSHSTPIVFVVHADATMRESIEEMLGCVDWQVWSFADAKPFLRWRMGADFPAKLLVHLHSEYC